MRRNNLIGILLLFLFCSCTGDKKANTESKTEKESNTVQNDLVQLTAEQFKNAGIQTGVAVQKEMNATLNVNGLTEAPPENVFSITVPLGGFIKKTNLIPGMMVRKGSVLASMEDQKYILLQQDYLAAKNKLKFAEADYARQKGLNLTKATSDKIFQQTESEFNQQKILLSSLAEQLRLIGLNPAALSDKNISRTIQIYAPIDAYVTKVNVNSGKYVNPADVLFELINPRKLHLSLTVLENDASRLKEGQKIICYSNKDPEKKYHATIHLITPNIEDDRSTSVHCDLENSGRELLPGTYMNATIKLENATVTALPEEALVKWEGKFYVFTDQGQYRYKMINVQPGVSTAGFTEIKSALPEKSIVLKNAYALLMKMKNGGE